MTIISTAQATEEITPLDKGEGSLDLEQKLPTAGRHNCVDPAH